MAGYEGSGESGDVTVQDYDFLGQDQAATAKYNSGVDCAGMEAFGEGVVSEGCERGMNLSGQSLDQVGDIFMDTNNRRC